MSEEEKIEFAILRYCNGTIGDDELKKVVGKSTGTIQILDKTISLQNLTNNKNILELAVRENYKIKL